MKKYNPYLIPALIAALLALGAVYLISIHNNDTTSQKRITNYQECVEAGNPSLESYPAQCVTPDKQNFTQDVGNELKIKDLIRTENPRPNQAISSPFEIKGEAVGNWFFEASFPAILLDANGQQLAMMPITAQSNWMTTEFVPFKETMTFPTPTTPNGTLILRKENPSGLSEHDNELRIPIKFSQHNPNQTTVKVFFNNSSLSAECEKTVAITREVTQTSAIARSAIEELIKGVTQDEKNKGYSSQINSGVKINSLAIKDGVAKIDLSSELETNSGGSCRALAIRSQITQTLKQFPTVKDVTITVNGNANILQP